MGNRAGVTHKGVHVLRYTLLLAFGDARGFDASYSGTAGHQNISTTQRYMYLSPAARGAALRLLDEAPASATRADIGDNEKRRTLKEPVCIDEKWWRRRESNPRPRARRRRTLHACPLLLSRARRVEAAKNRRAPGSVHLTRTRRVAMCAPACLMAFGPQPPGKAKANVTAI